MSRYIIGVLVVLLALAVAGTLWFRGSAAAAGARADRAESDASAAKDEVDGLQRSLTDLRGQLGKYQSIGDDYEDARRDAERVPGDVAAGIDSGALRLRRQWAACETARLSESAAATVERDALAQLRRKDQGDLVRVGRDADDLTGACQAVIRAGLRGLTTSDTGQTP